MILRQFRVREGVSLPHGMGVVMTLVDKWLLFTGDIVVAEVKDPVSFMAGWLSTDSRGLKVERL